MSIQLQPPVPLVSLVKTEPPTVIKNEPPEEALQEEISTDMKHIDIVSHPLREDLIKSETVLEDILENKHLESVQTQALLVKTENSPFIKTENITQRNKSEETSDGSVSGDTGQGMVVVQGSHSNTLSNLETHEHLVLNPPNGLNCIVTRIKNVKHPKKANSWKKDKEKMKVIKAPVIPFKPHEYTSLAKDKRVCNHCQHACNTLSNLKRHIDKMHREVTTMYQCPYCPHKSKYNVQTHIIRKHRDTKDIQWFQCNLCEKKFKLKYDLNRHKRVHLTREQMKDGLDLKRNMHREVTTMYQCPYCSYNSKWKHNIKMHIIQKHTDTKDIQWFQCNLCEMKFKLKGDLIRHMKVHLRHKQMKDGLDVRETRYHCNNCDYKTGVHHNLKRHNLVHLKPEETKYFYCYHCSHKSNQKFDLKRHIFRRHFKNVKQEKKIWL